MVEESLDFVVEINRRAGKLNAIEIIVLLQSQLF
jgi:hypothetical protein